MTFDSCLINIQPTETVFKAALILSGHQTRSSKAARSQPCSRSNTGTFKSLRGPISHRCCRLITLPAWSQYLPLPGVGTETGRGGPWLQPSWKPGRRAGSTQHFNPARASPSAPGTAPTPPSPRGVQYCLHPCLPEPNADGWV